MKEFRLHVRRDRSSSVLRWVRKDDVNGALVGWWKCWWWWVFSRAQEVCFLTLQSLPSPLISCLPCSMFDPGKSTNIYPPLWKEYLYLSKWWTNGSQREKECFPQIWGATLKKHRAESSVGAWTVWACAYLCLKESTHEKQLSEGKSAQMLMDCKSVWRGREF